MKKPFLTLLIIFILIVVSFAGVMINYRNSQRQMFNFNRDYEQCRDRILLGVDIATLINKAMDSNQRNNVEKDKKNYYIDNGCNSVRIFVQLETDGDYYPMERIFEYDLSEFVKNFNLQDYKCSKIEYHKRTRFVSKIYFDILES